MRIEPLNEHSFMIYFSEDISDETADQIVYVLYRLQRILGHLIIDMIPSYTSIVIDFDLRKVSRHQMQHYLTRILARSHNPQEKHRTTSTQMVEIPTYYGPEVALDMSNVCQYTGLTEVDIIRRHSQRTYRVYAVGFSPGFAFLGHLDAQLVMPRKSTPRLSVPAGSVGLANQQTAVYPSDSPGGWQIIGRTPKTMFHWEAHHLHQLSIGDRILFKPIDRETFIHMGGTFQ